MSRTRGASGNFDYSGDGEMLGKGGVPLAAGPIQRVTLDRQGHAISPAAYQMAAPRALGGGTVLHGPGAEPVADPGRVVAYKADRTTFSRNMEAYELVGLLEMMLGKINVLVTPEEFATLNGDLRRHFKAVRAMDMPPEEEEDDDLMPYGDMTQEQFEALPANSPPPRRSVGWPKGKPRKPVLPPFPIATPDE
jgi:hypothetical protein